jgi:hypothetical protein
VAAGIFRFFNAVTEEQKAVAVYDWVCLSMRRGNAVYAARPAGAGNLEPGRMFHVHGHHFDGLGRLMVSIWRATGRPARKTVIQAWDTPWPNSCTSMLTAWPAGTSRPQKGWYVYDRTGSHVAVSPRSPPTR